MQNQEVKVSTPEIKQDAIQELGTFIMKRIENLSLSVQKMNMSPTHTLVSEICTNEAHLEALTQMIHDGVTDMSMFSQYFKAACLNGQSRVFEATQRMLLTPTHEGPQIVKG